MKKDFFNSIKEMFGQKSANSGQEDLFPINETTLEGGGKIDDIFDETHLAIAGLNNNQMTKW